MRFLRGAELRRSCRQHDWADRTGCAGWAGWAGWADRAGWYRLSEQADGIVLMATTQSQVQHFTRAMYIGQSANHFTAPGAPEAALRCDIFT
jgi:hypothetical protein